MSSKNVDSSGGEGNDLAAQVREKARLGREQQKSAERRQKLGTIALFVLVGLLVVGIVGGAFWFAKGKDSGGNGSSSSQSVGPVAPGGPFPKGVTEPAVAVNVNAPTGKGVPVVQVWTDFQCPFCAAFDQMVTPRLVELANQKSIALQLRPATFLDERFPESNNASARATSAWGCAIDANKTVPYYEEVFKNQPAREGEGYTNEKLIQIGEQVGIVGGELAAFKECVNKGTYLGWAAASQQQFLADQISGTPTVLVNGKKVEAEGKTMEEFMAAILQAAKVQ